MPTHTPGPFNEPLTGAIKNQEFLECGCLLACDANDRQSIAYCPTHAAAPEMRQLLKSIVIAASIDTAGRLDGCDLVDARALLATCTTNHLVHLFHPTERGRTLCRPTKLRCLSERTSRPEDATCARCLKLAAAAALVGK